MNAVNIESCGAPWTFLLPFLFHSFTQLAIVIIFLQSLRNVYTGIKMKVSIVKSANSPGVSDLVICYSNAEEKKKTHKINVTVTKQSPWHLLPVYSSEVNLTVWSDPKLEKW